MILLALAACTRDQVAQPEPCDIVKSYDAGVREIIRPNCNTSGCHDGSSGVGNYNTYQGMKRIIENGQFRQLVIVEKTMPKGSDLTPADFEVLKCWAENSYPEN